MKVFDKLEKVKFDVCRGDGGEEPVKPPPTGE